MTVDTEMSRMSCAHQSWDLPDSAVTPETYYLPRLEFLRMFGLGLAVSLALQIARLTKMLLTRSTHASRLISIFGKSTTSP